MSDLSQSRLEAGYALRILDSKQDIEFINSLEALPKIADFCSDQSRFEELISLLKLAGVKVVVNDRLVRGLDYYNGTCFEIKCLSQTIALGESQNTVLAGGRYDNLSAQYIGKSVPAFGWAAGIDRLALLL